MKQEKSLQLKNNPGFTLIETLVAILVLTLTMGALFSLAAGGIFSARYARNQIVATYLLQESIEAIRNSRDSALQDAGYSWNQWLLDFNVDSNGNSQSAPLEQGCFSSNGCIIDPHDDSGLVMKGCNADCSPVTYYPTAAFYGYTGSYSFIESAEGAYLTSYRRKIRFTPVAGNPDQYMVTGQISWLNGSATKTISQSILLTNWQP